MDVEKVAAVFRAKLNLENVYFMMGASTPDSHWNLIDCNYTVRDEAEKAFSKRVHNTKSGVLVLLSPTNEVLSRVDCENTVT